MNKKVKNPIQGRISWNRIDSGFRSMTTGMVSTTNRYTVLYYKRKNKVHRSKGVSKLDGTMVLVGRPEASTTPLFVTLRSTDTGDVVYQGRMHSNGNATGRLGVFTIDETISVGAYEVEILSCDDDKSDTKILNPIIVSKIRTDIISSREPLGHSDANSSETALYWYRYQTQEECHATSCKKGG